MIARNLSLAIAAASTGLLLAGCVVREQTTVYERPRPVVVQDPNYVQPPPPVVYQPTPQPVIVEQQPTQVIVVHRDPPPIRIERVPRSPGPEFVWVKGYWAAQGGDWVWVGGRWSRPPHAGAVWVEPRYEHHGADVHFSMGFWR